jgi:hypothetical protein
MGAINKYEDDEDVVVDLANNRTGWIPKPLQPQKAKSSAWTQPRRDRSRRMVVVVA